MEISKFQNYKILKRIVLALSATMVCYSSGISNIYLQHRNQKEQRPGAPIDRTKAGENIVAFTFNLFSPICHPDHPYLL